MCCAGCSGSNEIAGLIFPGRPENDGRCAALPFRTNGGTTPRRGVSKTVWVGHFTTAGCFRSNTCLPDLLVVMDDVRVLGDGAEYHSTFDRHQHRAGRRPARTNQWLRTSGALGTSAKARRLCRQGPQLSTGGSSNAGTEEWLNGRTASGTLLYARYRLL